jgi:hypothetical protein
LAKLDYESGAVRVASTPFDTIFAGETYTGVGRLGSVTSISEGAEMRSYGVSLQMAGIPIAYFRDVASERIHDRACRVWYGQLDAQHRLIGVPVQLFGGRMDVMVVELSQTVSVTITAESRLVDWERARIRRFTDQDQKKAYPSDKGLKFVQASSEMELVWGRV